mmetsp:Transcript_45884/g.127450  ORF Transcript_45884/g.127450 Transcript_45884/m.127450 type:complete len:214 (+) Transcript_45884:324-965(+)
MVINTTILILLVVSLPAAVLGRYAMDKWSPHRMMCGSTLYMVVVTFVAPLFIRGGNDKTRAFGQMMVPVFAFLWGIGFGLYYPATSATYVSIIPPGSETELMGLFYFVGKVLSWMPPVVFVILNNVTGQSWVGIWALVIFYMMGLGLWCMMDMTEARNMIANLTDAKKKVASAMSGDTATSGTATSASSLETGQVQRLDTAMTTKGGCPDAEL